MWQVKELRNSGDEAARIIVANQQEGLDAPHNIARHFEHFLLLVSSRPLARTFVTNTYLLHSARHTSHDVYTTCGD